MMPQLAVIFDMDGVLVDSYHAHYESWKEMYRELDIEYSEGDFAADFGRTSRDILARRFGNDLTEARIREMDDRKEALYRDIIRAQFPAMEGATELIDGLVEAGFKIAVGSSGPPENIALSLELLASGAKFNAVVTGADVKHGKPDPEVFLTAAERLDVPPTHCAVVEDAAHGITAAKRAGMAAIAITGTLERQELGAADAIVDSLRQLSPQRIAALIASRQS